MAKQKIRYGINSVDEISFKYNPEKLPSDFDPNMLQLGFDNSLEALDGGNELITIDFGVKYIYKGEEILQSIYAYHFTVDNLSNYVKLDKDNQVQIEVIMPRLLNTALETMRGIILARTAGTPISKCPLPIFDVEETK